MAQLEIQPSINDTRSQALLKLIERLAQLDLTPLLIYRIASVPDGALPFLAWQFDILSPLWQLLGPSTPSIDAIIDIDTLTDIDTLSGPGQNSGAAQRAMIQIAISLHRTRGTPAAIKRALAQLGWSDVTILEGQASWGGAAWPESAGWAAFRVMVNLAPDQSVDSGAGDAIVAAIDFFKPARAWLDSLWFVAPPLGDLAPSPTDRLTAGGIAEFQLDAAPRPADPLAIAAVLPPLADQFAPVNPAYDAHFRHSGITYGADQPLVADSALILNGAPVLEGG